ncbi:MarR family winged helix-turn-helix transcriptional regulator [Aquibium carbonis]|uniref:MarR family winged helix-turn-helix transcriptional regulator n=1 Tax=Aquibium carbonis TaxID=2495581 RepID=UPI001AED0B41|nr:MarR family transcriptional regulator [Aquibium carbonis]
MTPLSRKPGHLIRRLHQISTHVFTERVREAGFDLTSVQYAALDALGSNLGVDQARLADMVAKDRATTGAVVERLEQKGLVSRTVNDRDKRARILMLTPEGVDLLARVTPVVEELQREILRGLDDHEYNRFIELAAKAAASTGSGDKA